MKQILKYPLNIESNQRILMTKGYDILNIAEKRGALCLWAIMEVADAEQNCTWLNISIYGTGERIDSHVIAKQFHIGTVLMSNGLVWHVYGHHDAQ